MYQIIVIRFKSGLLEHFEIVFFWFSIYVYVGWHIQFTILPAFKKVTSIFTLTVQIRRREVM